MRLAAFVVALLFARSAFAQNCTVGCPCGNTCISCQDTCRVGGGNAQRGGGGSGDTTAITLLILGAAGCIGLGGLVAWYFYETSKADPSMRLGGPSSAPAEPSLYERLDRCVAQMCVEEDWECARDVRLDFANAPSREQWLDERGCPG